MIVSHSEVDSITRCEMLHYYSYGEKLARKTNSISLQRGIAGHELLEAFFKNFQETRDWKKAEAAYVAKSVELLNQSTSVEVLSYLLSTIEGFLNFYKERIINWEIFAVEKEYRLDCGNEITYAFKPDLIIKENGVLIVVDYKFVYDFYDDISVSLSPQLPRYIGALRALKIPVQKGWYAFLRYRNVKTEGENNRFKLQSVPLTPDRIKNSFKDLLLSVEPIKAKKLLQLEEWHSSNRRSANILNCKACSFRELCTTELNGGNGKLMRLQDFQPSTYGYVEEQV